jgi:DNA-binding MarR family transcriptional regulator
MSEPNDQTVTAWVRLLRAQHAALSGVEKALKEAGHPPLSWYDVLLELDRAGDEGLRPFALQSKMLLPQYGISRLIDRVEKAGYLERIACDDDQRGHVLKITTAGKALRRRMWPVYSHAIQDAVGAKLTREEVSELSKILSKLL